MREIPQKYVRQVEGEPPRRWFEDNYFDLLVWEDEIGKIVGFQLCYDTFNDQRALTWLTNEGYIHNKVDDGESKPGQAKMSPILIADGIFDYEAIAEKFKQSSRDIDSTVSVFVYNKIKAYPEAK